MNFLLTVSPFAELARRGKLSADQWANHADALCEARGKLDGIEDFVISKRRALARVPVVHEHLASLEMEVILAVAAGLRNAEIAHRMRRSSKTI